jgi:hypothetical protein
MIVHPSQPENAMRFDARRSALIVFTTQFTFEVAPSAMAQAYPSKPVHVIECGFWRTHRKTSWRGSIVK